MLRTRTGENLDAWLDQVDKSELPELQSFAAGVKKDKDVVRAGLTWWINNGVGDRKRDEAETHQKTGIWPGRLSFAPQTCPSCPVSRASMFPDQVEWECLLEDTLSP